MLNKILDYEQVLSNLHTITRNSRLIRTHKPLGYTTFGLPILHYTYGTGKYNIVISGATHGSEIISTDLVLRLMEYLPIYLNKNTYTIHFFPMLNPEGYLTCTSAVREIIPMNMRNNDAQAIIAEYIELYNSGTLEYQKMFSHINYSCISSKYSALRKNIKELYERYFIPSGTLQVWSSNGNGIDLNQNCPYNYKLKYIEKNTPLYGKGAYSNILSTSPGPIGCPTSRNF